MESHAPVEMASCSPGSPDIGPWRSVGIVAGRPAISVVVPEIQIGILQAVFVPHVVDILVGYRLGSFSIIPIGDRADRTLLDNPDLCVAAGEDNGGCQYSGYVLEVCHNVLRLSCCQCNLFSKKSDFLTNRSGF